jgi:hypothetical protein
MAFKVNYGLERAERNRLKQAKKEAKLQARKASPYRTTRRLRMRNRRRRPTARVRAFSDQPQSSLRAGVSRRGNPSCFGISG